MLRRIQLGNGQEISGMIFDNIFLLLLWQLALVCRHNLQGQGQELNVEFIVFYCTVVEWSDHENSLRLIAA